MPAAAAQNARAIPLLRRLADLLPEGREIPVEDWARRHRAVSVLAWLHVPAIFAFAAAMGFDLAHGALEAGVVALAAAVATFAPAGRAVRSSAAAFALLSASAMLVHLSGGYIEMHFHFFVVLAVIALYQSWTPFLLSIGFVVAHHGAVGYLDPTSVFNHPGGIANPWLWGAIHGSFVLAASMASLVTWRLSEAHALRVTESDERLRTVLGGAPVILFGLDPQGTVTLFEGRGTDMLALPASAVLGRSALELYGDDPATARAIHRALAGEAFTTVLQRDGQAFEVTYAPRLDERGRVLGVTGMAFDVTQRMRSEAERRELDQLKSVNEFKTRFINTAAHELGTPLTPLKTNLYLLRQGRFGTLNGEQLRAIELLDRNVHRLATLVGDVLDGARIQAGQLRVRRERVDLAAAAAEAVEMFQEDARRAGLRLEHAQSPPLWADADPDRIAQVLSNLVGNALKFTPSGGWVRIGVRAAGPRGVVEVQDSGAGLRAEDLARLFQPFSQVHDPQDSRGGTGLGLYISKGIVEQHAGRIWAESPGPGAGATFTFDLPLSAEAAPSAPRAPAAQPASRAGA